MTATAIPLIKARLMSLMIERIELAGVQILYSHDPNNAENVHVALGSIENWSREFVGLGPSAQIDESFDLGLLAWCGQPGNSPEEADDKLFEVWDALTALYRDGVTLSEQIPELLWLELKPSAAPLVSTTEGAVTWIESVVECHTRI